MGVGLNLGGQVTVAVVVDVSRSTSEARVGGQYESEVMGTLEDAAAECALVIGLPADGNSVGTPPAFRRSFDTVVSGNSTLGRSARQREARALRPAVRELLRSRKTPGSDLLGSLQRARSLLAETRRAEKRVVLLTDGVLVIRGSRGYNLYADPPETNSARKKLIRSLKAADEIPDLSGIEVELIGAGAGVSSRRTARATLALWDDLLKEAGAISPDDGAAR